MSQLATLFQFNDPILEYYIPHYNLEPALILCVLVVSALYFIGALVSVICASLMVWSVIHDGYCAIKKYIYGPAQSNQPQAQSGGGLVLNSNSTTPLLSNQGQWGGSTATNQQTGTRQPFQSPQNPSNTYDNGNNVKERASRAGTSCGD